MDRYFVAPDALNDLCVWRKNGDYPDPVLAWRNVDDDELWDAIVDLVEGEK